MTLTITLHNTLGAAFIGTTLGASLYGLTTLQTYIYYTQSQSDDTTMKVLVGILWVLDSLHQIFTTHSVYEYAVTSFGAPLALLSPTWSVLATVIVTGISDGIIRGIFCYRIWKLSDKNIPVVLSITLTSLIAVGSSLAFSSEGYKFSTFERLEHVSWILYLGLAGSALSDILISITLCVLLSRRRSDFQRVDGIVRTLILYSINACALTSACSMGSIIAYAASPHTFIYIAFYFLLPKLLLNSLLATLNARKAFRENVAQDAHVHIPFPLEDVSSDRNAVSGRLSQFPVEARSTYGIKGGSGGSFGSG